MTSKITQALKSRLIRSSSHALVGRLFNAATRDQVSIFTLHRIHDPAHGINGHTQEFLRTTLSYLRREGYNLVSMAEVHRRLRGEGSPLRKAVAFTMDDGFIDQATIAAPIFAEFDCPVTIFLITGFLDGKLWPWDDRVSYIFSRTKRRELSVSIDGNNVKYEFSSNAQRPFAMHDFRNRAKLVSETGMLQALEDLSRIADVEVPQTPIAPYLPMTWDMARKLENNGVTFGPHTVSHAILARMTQERAEYEITESWRRLQQELSNPLPIFAYPTGRSIDFGVREFKILDAAGLSAALTTEPGYVDLASRNESHYARFHLNRFAFPGNIDDVIQYCSWHERAKMFLRMEHARIYTMEKYGGRRPTLSHFASVIWRSLGGYRAFREIDWSRVKRVVFVCKGNICRSPYAEVRARRYGAVTTSLGLAANSGAPANPEAIRNAAVRGIDLSQHRSKQWDDVQVEAGDLLVGMEPWQGAALRRLARNIGAQSTLLGIWGTPLRPYIHDPYGHAEAYFQTCFSVIDEAVDRLMRNIKNP